MTFKFYISGANMLKLKVKKFLGLVVMFVEVIGENWKGGLFLPSLPLPPPISFHPSILNRVKVISFRKFQKENFGFSQIDRKICAIINFREWSNYFISLCVFVLE